MAVKKSNKSGPRKAANLWILASVLKEMDALLVGRESISSVVEELLQKEIKARRARPPEPGLSATHHRNGVLLPNR